MNTILSIFAIASVIFSINVNAESNAMPIKLNEKALASFARTAKKTSQKTSSLIDSLKKTDVLWKKYDAAVDEDQRIRLASELSRTIKAADRVSKSWKQALLHERSTVHTLLKTATEDEITNIVMSDLSPQIKNYAKPLMDRYLDGLNTDKLRSIGMRNMIISVRDSWRKRRIRQSQESSNKGFYTKADLIHKIGSLDDNLVIASVLQETYADMVAILSKDIENGVLSNLNNMNQSKSFMKELKKLKNSANYQSNGHDAEPDNDVAEYLVNPFE